jgi:hypothetical protein
LLSDFYIMERTAPSRPRLENVEREIHRRLGALDLPVEKLCDRRIGVTAGSRGIASLREVIAASCAWLKSQGARPFVFPAMGSHGGATPEGQQDVLAGYGITAETVGAEIVSSMETLSLGRTGEGVEVFMDRNASEAGGVLVVNRVKPHTAFSGKIESGLVKMMAVGAGKRQGAEEIHRACRRIGYEAAIRSAAGRVLASGKILAGLALVENQTHQLCAVEALGPEEILAGEERILAASRELVARIPFWKIDLLIVDEMGKNISGAGMDTKVIGRGIEIGKDEAPEIRLIYVRALTAESGGNALGVGMADLIHERLFRKIDLEKTYVNVRTSLNAPMARVPMHFASDRAAIDFALAALGGPEPARQRTVRIQNTLCLGRIAISASLAGEAAELEGWEISAGARAPRFDAEGNLERLI